MAVAESVQDDVDELDRRALEQYLTVLEDQGRVRDCPGQYLVVSQSGSEYLVDARLEACECPDYEYRGHKRPCKHLRRVAFATGEREIPNQMTPSEIKGDLGEHVMTRSTKEYNDDNPWRHEDVLLELHWDKGLTLEDIGDQFGITHQTVMYWFDKHDIETRAAKRNKPWRDRDELKQRIECGKTYDEIADEFECDESTVAKWAGSYGLNPGPRTEEATEARRTNRAWYHTRKSGYELAGDQKSEVAIHRLTAVAEYGFDLVAGNIVHHKNHIPWDNRAENLEPMSRSDHMKIHQSEGDLQ